MNDNPVGDADPYNHLILLPHKSQFVGLFLIEPLANRARGMNKGELLVFIIGLLDERCLKRVEDHTEGC